MRNLLTITVDFKTVQFNSLASISILHENLALRAMGSNVLLRHCDLLRPQAVTQQNILNTPKCCFNFRGNGSGNTNIGNTLRLNLIYYKEVFRSATKPLNETKLNRFSTSAYIYKT